MNEIVLSNNLNQIELEIKHHKQIAGQSIWEIGRRLNHVKENDLAHGEFGKWLEKMDIYQDTANKFMRVAKELNSDTYSNLGYSDLYLIATLPEEEREKEHRLESGETKEVDETTRPAPEKNLVNIPFEDLANHYQSLGPSKQIFTLCGSGNRSTAAASFLESKGLHPKVIEGGMKAIQEVIK